MAATKPYLQSLMSAALTLPGIAAGQTALDSATIDYKRVAYEEDDGLMQVDADYFTVGVPFNENNDLKLNLEYETISGASPIFMTPDSDGTPIQVVSGASITDERTAFSMNYQHFLEGGNRILVTPSTSDENDYNSKAVTFEYQWDSENKNTTFSLGGGLASDEVSSAVDPNIGGNKDGTSLFFGVTRLLSAKSLIQFNLSLADESGYLSDPYKLTLVADTIAFENRPSKNQSTALFGRYIRHFGENSSLHLSYRLYDDDWSITSHTIEGSWYFELSRDWLIVPTIRYYSQDKADFYAPYFIQARSDGFHSSDYRLAGFGSILAGISIEKGIGNRIRLSFDADQYERDGDLKIGSDYSIDPLPLSSFMLTFGLSYTF